MNETGTEAACIAKSNVAEESTFLGYISDGFSCYVAGFNPWKWSQDCETGHVCRVRRLVHGVPLD
jgi:hypothetical protein